jgi:hypothetical protein
MGKKEPERLRIKSGEQLGTDSQTADEWKNFQAFYTVQELDQTRSSRA